MCLNLQINYFLHVKLPKMWLLLCSTGFKLTHNSYLSPQLDVNFYLYPPLQAKSQQVIKMLVFLCFLFWSHSLLYKHGCVKNYHICPPTHPKPYKYIHSLVSAPTKYPYHYSKILLTHIDQIIQPPQLASPISSSMFNTHN